MTQRPRRRLRAAASLPLLSALGGVACGSGEPDARLSERGRQGRDIYRNVCIACHHADPVRDGTLGPAVAGASEALLAAKVVAGEYPPGYTPKRPDGRTMPRFEYLADDIPVLAAYLAEVAEAEERAAAGASER